MEIARACGHETTLDTTGLAPFERDDKLAYLARTRCPDCDPKIQKKREKERAQWIAKQEKAAIEAEKEFGFDQLQGSPKMVAWARRIRVGLVTQAFDLMDLSEDDFTEQVGDRAGKVTSARWWIDHKDANVEDLPGLLDEALGVPANVDGLENPFE